MLSTNVFNELCVKLSLLRSIPKKIITVYNAVYFRLCIDLPFTAEGNCRLQTLSVWKGLKFVVWERVN